MRIFFGSYPKEAKNKDRGVEQLVARWAHNPKVAGSSPAPATQKPGKIIAGLFLYKISFVIPPPHALCGLFIRKIYYHLFIEIRVFLRNPYEKH